MDDFVRRQTAGGGVVIRVGVGCVDPRLAAAAAAVVVAAGSTVVEIGERPPSGLAYAVVDESVAAGLQAPPVGVAGIAVVVATAPAASTWAIATRLRALVVALPDGEALLLDALLAAAVATARTPTITVAVLGAVGGCGATTAASAMALALARCDRPCALIDLDRLGGGIDIALGAEREPGARWPDLMAGSPAASLVELPAVAGVRLVSWDRRRSRPPPAELLLSVLAAIRTDLDVVVDLSRSMPIAIGDLAADGVVVVSPMQVRAAAAAAILAGDLETETASLIATSVPAAEITASDLATASGLPLLGTLSSRPRRRARDFDRIIADWLPRRSAA